MRILIGVCGSVSAYKTFDIVRTWVKSGHEVKVILTRGATEFVKPQLYKYLGAKEVYSFSDDFNYPKNEMDKGNVLHIELANWCDRLIVCPLSANTLAKLAHGMSDDLLTSTFLAMDQKIPIILYPAMNSNMLTHPFTKENIDLVKKIKTLPQVFVHPTAKGMLACGVEGEGKLPDVELISETALLINPTKSANKKHIVITTGATISPLDPVRYLTNSSSGLTGFLIAQEALALGHDVTVIAGKSATKKLDFLNDQDGYKLERVITTTDMANAVTKVITTADAYISAAAICDLEFSSASDKLKKSALGNSLQTIQATDILAGVLGAKLEKLKVVGFAAETQLTQDMLFEKWNRKKVDLLVGTHVHSGLTDKQEQAGFGTNSAKYSFMKDGEIFFSGHLDKAKLPSKIFETLNY